MIPGGEITQLLSAASAGDRDALDRVFDLVYRELRSIARGQLASGETLRTTALVHEVYLRMAQGQAISARDREHFYATAARAMRQILVDHARRRAAGKRGGGVRPEVLDDQNVGLETREEEILAIDTALSRLEDVDIRLAKLVEMRFYGGLSVAETAETLGLSERTVKRDWRKARAFLYHELHGSAA
ncbi:MAG TPA: ECF-type sigma factor [Thermoanaerobaculia bacterium]|nr:ECF-type sigma factor [Thermoanaerobaculia bacterium]